MKFLWAVSLFACLSLAGCASVDGQGRYATQTIGNFNRSVKAVIVGVEPVSIRMAGPEGSGYGAVAGGSLALGSDDPGIVLVGMLVGAVVGDAVGDAARVRSGTKYSLLMDNGATLQVAQLTEGNELYRLGETVTVQYGYPNRLSRNTSP